MLLHYIALQLQLDHNYAATTLRATPLQLQLRHFTLHYTRLHYITPLYSALQLQLQLQLHYNHWQLQQHLKLRHFPLHYTRLHYITQLYITCHQTHYTSTFQLQTHYTNYTTPQLQLQYITTKAALHHTQSSSCG